MTPKKICSYCGKEITGPAYYDGNEKEPSETYCSQACQQKHKEALQSIRKRMKWFAIGIVGSLLLIFSAAFMASAGKGGHSLAGGGGMILLGITLVLFPYCTPETYQKLGYVKASWLGRGLGILTGAFGVWILLKG